MLSDIRVISSVTLVCLTRHLHQHVDRGAEGRTSHAGALDGALAVCPDKCTAFFSWSQWHYKQTLGLFQACRLASRFFRKKSLMLTKAAVIWPKIRSEILLQFKITAFYLCLYVLKCNLFLWCKAEFSAAITPVFSVTWSFRNHFKRTAFILII